MKCKFTRLIISMPNCINIVSSEPYLRIVPQLITEYKNPDSGAINTYGSSLLLLSENNYLTYCIINEDGQYELLREYKMTPGEKFTDFHRGILASDEYLGNAFKSVSIGISNKRMVLVPGVVFNREESVRYLESSAPVWSTDEVKADYLEKQDIHMVYAFRSVIYQAYRNAFPNMKLENALSSYIKQLETIISVHDLGYKVFVNALHDTLYIVVYRNRQLSYANVYEFSTAEDFLYYIMLIYKEFHLDPGSVPTYLSGKLDSNSTLHDLLKRYIREPAFIEELSEPTLVIDSLPAHVYFDLSSLDL